MAAPYKKGKKVIVLAGQHSGRTGVVVDEPVAVAKGWEVMVLLDDPLGMGIQTIAKFISTDLLKR